MRRVPFWFAIVMEIFLIFGYIDGMYGERALYIAVINFFLIIGGLGFFLF